MIYLRVFSLVCCVFVFWIGSLGAENENVSGSIQIDGKPILHFNRENPSQRIFGALKFMGGLELSSSDPRFGGISGLRIQQGGTQFLALSDRAYWIRGRLVYAENRPASIADAEIAAVFGSDGEDVSGWDTESVAVTGNFLHMGVEGLDRIPIFIYEENRFPLYIDAIPFLPGVRDLPRNGGLEAIAFLPEGKPHYGSLIALTEKGLDEQGNHICYIIHPSHRIEQEQFKVRRSKNFDISDAVVLPEGDLLTLERKYDIENGVSIRLRRLRADAIRPGAVVDGKILLEADMQCEVDNMEAVGVHRSVSGRTILTLISDNNYSSLQRTLLLQFELNSETTGSSD